jgi:hypothetical protein
MKWNGVEERDFWSICVSFRVTGLSCQRLDARRALEEARFAISNF